VSKIDEAAVSCARDVRGGAIIVGMLGAKTPATSLPQGALFNPMTRFVLIASEAVWELDFVSLTSFAKYCTMFQTVFSFFDIRWALGSEEWNLIIAGRNKKSGGGRGTYGKKMLLKAGTNCT